MTSNRSGIVPFYLPKLSCLVLLCIGLFAPAQDDLELDFSSMSLEDLLNVEVSVASKTEEKLSDAPSTVSVFTRNEILNMGVRTLEELLNFVPGFQTSRLDQDVITTQSPSARGKLGNSHGDDLLVLINGQRLNQPWRGGAFNKNHRITLANVKQVELIRGPGSALYGSNAFLGVVNLVTETGVNEGSISFGDMDSVEAYAQISKSLGNDVELSMFARSYKDSGYDYENLPNWTGQSVATKDPQEDMDAYLSLRSKSFDANVRFLQRREEDFLSLGTVHNSQSPRNSESTSTNLTYRFYQSDNFNAKLYGSYIVEKRRNRTPLFAPGVGQSLGLIDSPVALIGGDDQEQSQIQFALDTDWTWGDNSFFSAGVSYREANIDKMAFRTNVDTEAFFNAEFPVRTFDEIGNYSNRGELASRDILGIYLQGKYSFSSSLSATVGVRYDDYSDFGDTTNPRGALVYNTPFNSTIKLLYGEAFKAPGQGQRSEVSLTFAGNPDLQPEVVQTLELGYIQNIGKTQFALTYFDTQLDDVILEENIGTGGFVLLRPDNLGTLDLSGLEVEFTASLSQSVFVRANYTSLIDTEENPRRVSDQTGSFIINYSKNRFNLNLNGYFRNEVERPALEDGSFPELDSFTIVNLALRYAFTADVAFIGRAYNLNDEDYFTDPESLLTDGFPNRGSTYTIGAEVKF